MDVGQLFRMDLDLVSFGGEPLAGASAVVEQTKGK